MAPDTRMRILICEDDDLLRPLIRRALASRADVVACATGREALEAAASGGFDAVGCDVSLPDMSGLDMVPLLREHLPAAGIVVVTGYGDIEVAVNAMKAGADDFLTKPFEYEILWHVLNKACDARRDRMAAAEAAAYRTLAYTDALTDCHNRRFLDEYLDTSVALAREHGQPLTAAYIDVDNFKLINDHLGHQEGDALLRAIADAMRRVVTAPAVFGRYGGDEFIALFPQMTRPQALPVLDRLRRVTSRTEIVTGTNMAIPARLSIGVAELTPEETPRQLIARAEDAMYLDKSMGQALGLDSVGSLDDIALELSAENLTTLKTLRGLVLAIDRRDSYTRYHSDDATRLAIQMADRLTLEEAERNAIALGGPLHDLGKIVVPDSILRKPGPLTLDERQIMETHPVTGAAIVNAVIDVEAVVGLVRHHHERFDGGGYPAGLRDTQIPLVTRLFALADAFSAMTTDRPYRRGMDIERAADLVRQGAGTQFDPDLAPVFADMVESQDGTGLRASGTAGRMPRTGS